MEVPLPPSRTAKTTKTDDVTWRARVRRNWNSQPWLVGVWNGPAWNGRVWDEAKPIPTRESALLLMGMPARDTAAPVHTELHS